MNLEIKHIAPYLPYGLRPNTAYEFTIVGADLTSVYCSHPNYSMLKILSYKEFKPILRPLSDLTKVDIKEFYQCSDIDMGIIDWQEWAEELYHSLKNDNPFQLSQFEYLYKRHFDVFGLIENNLAIDFNTLK